MSIYDRRPPWFYDYVNTVDSMGLKPSTLHVKDTNAAYFFKRQLLQRALSVFEFTLPENWDKDYFLYTLYCFGYVGVLNTDRFGIIPQQCALKGYNVFYHPREIVVVNPLLNQSLELTIGTNCEVVKLQPDYGGVMDLVNYYGDLLALTYEAALMNIANSKLSIGFAASNKNVAQSFKKIFDNVQGGDLMVAFDKDMLGDLTTGKPWEPIINDLSHNYITLDLLETMRDINNMFDTEIGINNNTVAKKRERVNTAEVNANNAETFTKVDLWYETIKEDLDRVNKMFYDSRDECTIKWREVPNNAESNLDAAGTLSVYQRSAAG